MSGSTVIVAGLTGALRGQSHALATGEVIRPDLVLLDDPQTRDSAKSASQTSQRTAIVLGDVLGMAGPNRHISAIMPCTVIYRDDLADQLLDRQRNPQWSGLRTRSVTSWPTAEKLWETYFELRADAKRSGRGPEAANEFYKKNRAEMDAGGEVSWPERKREDELSALQHCMNLRQDLGDEAFFAEFQNDPQKAGSSDVVLTASQIAGKLLNVAKGTIPKKCNTLTMAIDVQDKLLYWIVTAWAADFTGHVVSYGPYPEQRRSMFSLKKASPTLAEVAPGAGREGAIRAGLEALCNAYLGRDWQREDGTVIRVERCLFDSGYVPDVVYEFCRHSTHAAVLMPSRGVGIGAAKAPMSEWPKKEGEKHGWHWLTGKISHRTARYVRFDANHWKSFLHGRLGAAVGDAGSLTLFGSRADDHRLFAEHITAEAPIDVTANGRTVSEWRMRPGFADNHWLDTLVGCAVAASMLGSVLSDSGGAAKEPKKKKRSLADMYQEAKSKAQNT